MSSLPRLLLASTSPSRRKILGDTGFAFEAVAPEVDERAAITALREAGEEVSPAREAQLLAIAKAEAGAAALGTAPDGGAPGSVGEGRLVLGCDSVFELDGVAYGKPYTAEVAAQRWRGMRGNSGILHTGHHLINAETGASASALVSTTVHFGDVSDAEIEAYVASGEPLYCAGAFTVDGLAAAFVTGLEGDFHAVVGLSPSALRGMAAELGVPLSELWAAPTA